MWLLYRSCTCSWNPRREWYGRGHKSVHSATAEVLDSLYTKASKRVYRLRHSFRSTLGFLFSPLSLPIFECFWWITKCIFPQTSRPSFGIVPLSTKAHWIAFCPDRSPSVLSDLSWVWTFSALIRLTRRLYNEPIYLTTTSGCPAFQSLSNFSAELTSFLEAQTYSFQSGENRRSSRWRLFMNEDGSWIWIKQVSVKGYLWVSHWRFLCHFACWSPVMGKPLI